MMNNSPNVSRTIKFLQQRMERFISHHAFSAEEVRWAQTLIGFCWAGSFFCLAYVVFYTLIGFDLGALYVLGATLACLAVPFFIKQTGKLSLAGGISTSSIILLFLAMSTIEGGLHGHSIGWLAAMPLCAFLLNGGGKQGLLFSLLMTLSVGYIAIQPWINPGAPPHYPKELHDLVTAVGYVGLALFMVAMAALFEGMRNRAFIKSTEALRQLEIANENLAKLVKEKDKFLGIAAHDLKNPLQGIRGFTELLLLNKNSDSDTLKNCPHIIESADRMLGIIDNLLDVNAMESGRYPVQPEMIDLEPLLQSCLKSYEHPASLKGITWEIDIESVQAWADTAAWKQIADNLISNAVKFVLQGGAVRVRLTQENGATALVIANQCKAFSEDDFTRLFKRFAKLSTRPTGGEGSTGLGLSIAQKLAKDMGGEITCHNEAGFGPVFTAVFLKAAPYSKAAESC